MSKLALVESDLTDKLAESLFNSAATYIDRSDMPKLKDAFYFSNEAHRGQYRRSGEPYITHPIAVTEILISWRMDVQTLCAGLLHDVMEDTCLTKMDIAAQFGVVVANLVDGLSKLERIKYESRENNQAESLRKMVMAMARDIRVIIVKLADRLHNMRTLDIMQQSKKVRISRETINIYAPIANRLGLNLVYRELQDLSLKNERPALFEVLRNKIEKKREVRASKVSKLKLRLEDLMKEAEIPCTIIPKYRSFYSVHLKMQSANLNFNELLDVQTYAVVVGSKAHCYLALGVLHSKFLPIPLSFKDFIATPKKNGYKSLHTRLANSKDSIPFEIQIRTKEMDDVANYGVLVDLRGKSAGSINPRELMDDIFQIEDSSLDAIEFVEHIKSDLNSKEIFVFTPDSDIISLPVGSTVIDFAYALHTDIGEHCVGCKVNDVSLPISTELRNGDKIEIETNPHSYPSISWLNFAATGRAKSRIRYYLKRINPKQAIQLGIKLLEQSLQALDSTYTPVDDSVWKLYFGCKSQQECKENYLRLMTMLGSGDLNALEIAEGILRIKAKNGVGSKSVKGVLSLDNNDVNFHFSGCCSPIPDDLVVGFLTGVDGITIHQKCCQQIKHLNSNHLIPIKWRGDSDRMYSVPVEILAKSERGAVAEVTSVVAKMGANLQDAQMLNAWNGDGFITIKLRIQVKNKDHLSQILQRVSELDVVMTTRRKYCF